MKAKTRYQTEEMRPVCDHKSAITHLTRDIGGLLGLFIEALWNSYEHGQAEHIWVTVRGKGVGYEIDILDDGSGMNAARRQRSVDLAVQDPKRGGRNYMGLGMKRMAADFRHAKIMTISADEQKADPDGYPMWVIEYDWDKLFDLLAGRASGTINARPVSPDWDLIGLPKGSSGTKIVLTGAREEREHFMPERLRRLLSESLSPWVAERVFVNGEPLPKRQIVGELLREKVHDEVMLGDIRLELYAPKEWTSRDRLMVGAHEGICEWRDFCEQIPPDVLKNRLGIMANGVFGVIYVPALARFVTPSRRDFEARLFASPEIGALVDCLDSLVVGDVERILGVVKQSAVSQRDKRLVDDLTDYMRPLGGGPRIAPKSNLEVTPFELELLPSSRMPEEIRVSKYNDDLTLVWETKKAGGRVEVLEGGETVKYWSGEHTGVYEMFCYYKEEPGTRATVKIRIVARKTLRVQPERATVHPGRIRTLRAINWEDDSSGVKNLTWKLADDDREGTFVIPGRDRKHFRRTATGDEVEYRAGSVEDTFRVTLFDSKKQAKQAYCDVTVTKEPERNPTPQDPKGGITIGGVVYEFVVRPAEKSSALATVVPTSSSRKQIHINTAHPGFIDTTKRRGYDGALVLMLEQVLLQHAKEEARARGLSITPEEMIQRVAALHARIAEERTKE